MTVSGTPLGLDISAVGSGVRGFLRYDTAIVDGDADATRGRYQEPGAVVWELTLPGGTIVRSSSVPRIEIEDFGAIDTFRLQDGRFFVGDDPRVDGVPDRELRFSIALSTSGDAWSSDALPLSPLPFSGDPFPSPPWFQTIALTDGVEGSLLVQFTRLAPRDPGPGPVGRFGILSITAEAGPGKPSTIARITLTWPSLPGESFAVEVSPDLERWETAVAGVPAPAGSDIATWSDDLPARFPDGVPGGLHYRVRRE